ncbi:hypothetical protein FACS189459_4210 [Bacilli bacterium]|nr:hypothetical protein FACS189459_4210 [Bacilli bacterium]
MKIKKILKSMLMPSLSALAITAVVVPVITSCGNNGHATKTLKYKGDFKNMGKRIKSVKKSATCNYSSNYSGKSADDIDMLNEINNNIKAETYFYASMSTLAGIDSAVEFLSSDLIAGQLKEPLSDIINSLLEITFPQYTVAINTLKFYGHSLKNIDIVTDVNERTLTNKSYIKADLELDVDFTAMLYDTDENGVKKQTRNLEGSPKINIGLNIQSNKNQKVISAGNFEMGEGTTSISAGAFAIGDNSSENNFSFNNTTISIGNDDAKEKTPNDNWLELEKPLSSFIEAYISNPDNSGIPLLPLFSSIAFPLQSDNDNLLTKLFPNVKG